MTTEHSSLSDLAKSVKLGKYKHFKGGEYILLGMARNSENSLEEFAVYESIENGGLWIRPLAMFLEHVDRDGYSGPRFIWIGKS